MIMANNLLGQDPLDFNDETAASRVGDRIRKIRTAKGLSQAELGVMVDLNADRIQKYENGARNPKKHLLKKIASALGVSCLALEDPTTSNYINAMFVLFEMEANFNMVVEKNGDKISLSFSVNEGIGEYGVEWYKMYTSTIQQMEVAWSEEERNKILSVYNNWKWTFPQGIVDKTEMQHLIKNKIEELQEVYNKLDDDDL